MSIARTWSEHRTKCRPPYYSSFLGRTHPPLLPQLTRLPHPFWEGTITFCCHSSKACLILSGKEPSACCHCSVACLIILFLYLRIIWGTGPPCKYIYTWNLRVISGNTDFRFLLLRNDWTFHTIPSNKEWEWLSHETRGCDLLILTSINLRLGGLGSQKVFY